MPPKQQILLERRRALRAWAHSQHPRPTQKACIEWFSNQYGQRISQSTVSESLSSHFDSLDSADNHHRARVRTGQWPELEKVLFDWQLRVEEKGGITSGELLREKARRIWHELPNYSNKPCPEFSVGWLQKFQKRYKIQRYIQHGEAGSVSQTIEEEMKGLRTLAGEFQEDDIYNMDETGLYWRMTPSRGLATQSRPGLKKDKSRVSLVLCVNSTATDRLPIWIIGKAKTPRALRGVNVSTMGGEWRANKKAWMNTAVMSEWLQAFYSHIGTTRQVLLTMDNFSAHYTGLELAPPPPNIRICWLPPNSTSRFQPLDQGVIQSFKSHYRRQWLSFMLDCFSQDQDPRSQVNIRLAIRWILRSWNLHISSTTIYNCFRKSTLVTTPITLPTPLNPPDIASLYERVTRAGDIQDAMAISNFLNPIDEVELEEEEEKELDQEDLFQDVLSDHLGLEQAQEEDDDDDILLEGPIHSIQAARKALQLLVEFTESRDDVQTIHIRAIERLEQELEAIDLNSRTQSTLDSWLI